MDYYIMQEAVSAERLQQLRIRHTAVELENEVVREVLGEALSCWVVATAGLDKLERYGYVLQHSVKFETGDEACPEGTFVALANPDQTPASLEVDPATIKVVKFNGNIPSSLQSMLAQLSKDLLIPAFNRHVQFTYTGEATRHTINKDDGILQVVLGGSPITGRMDLPSTLWGASFSAVSSSLNIAPYITGRAVITDENFEVASFDDTNIFIYPDLVYHIQDGCTDNLALINKILQQVAEMHNSPGGIDYDQIESRYVDACSKRVSREINRVNAELEDAQEKAKKHQRELVEQLRIHQRLQRELQVYMAEGDTMADKLRREFRALLDVPHVVEIDWRGDFMAVTTDKLYVIDPRTGHEHEVGAFKLIINHITSDVEFHNITRRVRGYEIGMNGPHVFATGRACLGSMQETIPMLVANYEWAALVQMCIAFLESVNTEDTAGHHVNRWPRSRTKDQIANGEPRRGEPREFVEGEAEPEPGDETEEDYDEDYAEDEAEEDYDEDYAEDEAEGAEAL